MIHKQHQDYAWQISARKAATRIFEVNVQTKLEKQVEPQET